MRKLHPDYPPMKERDVFKFGKYRGLPLWKVLDKDPAYVRWLLRNLPGFSLDTEARAWLEALSRFGL